jgi:hypothetical protein
MMGGIGSALLLFYVPGHVYASFHRWQRDRSDSLLAPVHLGHLGWIVMMGGIGSALLLFYVPGDIHPPLYRGRRSRGIILLFHKITSSSLHFSAATSRRGYISTFLEITLERQKKSNRPVFCPAMTPPLRACLSMARRWRERWKMAGADLSIGCCVYAWCPSE